MSSILTFSNRSVKLFTLKNRFLITEKVLHSIRMCLTVEVVWQVKHCGCGSCLKMKEWVSLVWPIRNRDITTCSLLDFLNAVLHSPKVGWIWKSLLWMLLLHCCCHFVWRNSLIVGFRILDLSGVRSKADLAALSFPLTPMWLGVQHIIISFLFDIESNLLDTLMIRGFWNLLFLNDSKTESESENIINFLCLLFEMMLRIRSIAWATAVKIELSLGRAFLRTVLFKTAAHASLPLSLDPSVKTQRWSGWCWRIL